MKSLKDYIKSKSTFTVGGTASKKLLIFDVDDTLINTSANIIIKKNGKIIKYIPNKEFNNYILKPGEEFDFSEFNDPNILSKETFTQYWDTLKREYKKGTHISIITARNNKNMIKDFFLKNGIDIKSSLIFAVNDPLLKLKGTIQQKKSNIIKLLSKLGYDTFVFFDDDENNLKTAKSLENYNNIKIHTIKV